MKQTIHALVDLQFGSTGKGLLAGALAIREKYDTAVTAWMPNAGHTFVDEYGRAMVHTALANSIVSPNIKQILVAPGSVVDLAALKKEWYAAAALGYVSDVYIHENAAVLDPSHAEWEKNHVVGIGSTQKGSMAAVVAKLKRDPSGLATAGRVWGVDTLLAQQAGVYGLTIQVVNHDGYMQKLRSAEKIILEGAQGYSLGINNGFYPYTTSRQCTVAQLCSDTLVPPGLVDVTWGCARTFPIRVANRYNAGGELTGWSGPCYSDQEETTFAAISQKQENTTVTGLPRRIFTWSDIQMTEALYANQCGELRVFLNFANYLPQDRRRDVLRAHGATIARCGARLAAIGYGPQAQDIDWDVTDAC
jgi:adenylosuccinate synthase